MADAELDEETISRLAKDSLLLFSLSVIHELAPQAIPNRLRAIQALRRQLEEQRDTPGVRNRLALFDVQADLLGSLVQDDEDDD